jgi:sulfur carrier protein
VISIFINGASRSISKSSNLAELLTEMQLTGKRIAIERNGEIVPRGQFTEQTLNDGDQLEIVVAVGGG